MESKFDFRDIVNYVFSGFLWLIFLAIVLSFSPQIFWETFFKHLKDNIGVYKEFIGICTVLLIFLSYFVGNILRPLEFILVLLVRLLFDNLYENALKSDKKEKYRKVGKDGKETLPSKILNRIFKTVSINSTYSKHIYLKLAADGLVTSNKKSQFIMVSKFVKTNKYPATYDRLKNLKDLYESTFVPLLAIVIVIPVTFRFENVRSLSIYIFACLVFIVIFVKRYVQTYHNYIKDVYRNYLVKK